MEASGIPIIEDNPDVIEQVLPPLRDFLKSHINRSIQWRTKMLKTLRQMMKENENQIAEAVEKDLNRNPFLQKVFQMDPILHQIQEVLEKLDKWMQPETVPTPMAHGLGCCKILREPLGVCLIISAWNFPFWELFYPLITVFAAGNNALIKPSEMAPFSSRLIKKLMTKYYMAYEVGVVEGGVQVAKAITSAKVDAMIFTGSPQKGRLVAAAASQHLVPCILELGGKCPTIVDSSADVDLAARKISSTKFFNCGQTCVTTDYLLVHHQIHDQFIATLKRAIVEQYGERVVQNQDMGKIINIQHTNRIASYLEDNHQGEVVIGGGIYFKNEFIEPTVVLNPRLDSKMMKNEIFGPILPVYKFKNIDEAINFINSGEKPLALYYFGAVWGNNNKDRVINETSSGSLAVNEILFQVINPNLPFGGVGNSGYGKYHGFDGFCALTNAKSMLIKPALNFFPFNAVHPPYNKGRQKIILGLTRMMGRKTQAQMMKRGLLVITAIVLLILWRKKVLSRFGCFISRLLKAIKIAYKQVK